MRDASPRFATTITGSYVAALRVDSWLGGRNLTPNTPIPIMDGTWEEDRDSRVPERVTITVPAVDPWLPRTVGHPLSPYGQRLRISRGVVLPDTQQVEFVQLGWARIQSYDIAKDSVSVEAVGLGQILDDARFLSAVQTSGNYAGAATSLAGGLLPVISTVADRAMPGRTWEDNRLDAMYELADTWPASMVVNASGTVIYAAADNDAADPVVATYTEGVRGTIVTALPSASRDGVYNAVRASGQETGDAPPVTAIAYDDQAPTAWASDYGQVPLFYASPLITTVNQAESAARTRLSNVRRTTTAFEIQAVIDPRTQIRDVIRVTSRYVTGVARVDYVSIPLVPGSSGMMTIRAHLLGGRA